MNWDTAKGDGLAKDEAKKQVDDWSRMQTANCQSRPISAAGNYGCLTSSETFASPVSVHDPISRRKNGPLP